MRHRNIVKHIVNYCNKIQETVNRYGNSFEVLEQQTEDESNEDEYEI